MEREGGFGRGRGGWCGVGVCVGWCGVGVCVGWGVGFEGLKVGAEGRDKQQK